MALTHLDSKLMSFLCLRNCLTYSFQLIELQLSERRRGRSREKGEKEKLVTER